MYCIAGTSFDRLMERDASTNTDDFYISLGLTTVKQKIFKMCRAMYQVQAIAEYKLTPNGSTWIKYVLLIFSHK